MKKITTFLSLFFALSLGPNSYAKGSSFFDDLMAGPEQVFEKRKIREWNSKNKNKVKILDGAGLWCNSQKPSAGKKDCFFTATLVNNTKDPITSLVIKISIYNKSKDVIVADSTETLEILIFPTIKKKIKVSFYSAAVRQAKSQLGKNYYWNYKVLGLVPQELEQRNQYTNKYADYGWLE